MPIKIRIPTARGVIYSANQQLGKAKYGRCLFAIYFFYKVSLLLFLLFTQFIVIKLTLFLCFDIFCLGEFKLYN